MESRRQNWGFTHKHSLRICAIRVAPASLDYPVRQVQLFIMLKTADRNCTVQYRRMQFPEWADFKTPPEN